MIQLPTLSARLEAFRGRTLENRRNGCDHFAAARLAAEMIGRVRGPALDIGTGHAIMASTLAAIHGVTVVTVDDNAADRDVAELVVFESGVRNKVQFALAHPGKLSFPDEYFGCAVMMDSICSIPQPAAVLRDLARVLQPDAAVVLGDLTPEGLALEANEPRADRSGVEPVRRDFAEVLALAAEQGLKLVLRAEGFLHDLAVLRKDGPGERSPHPAAPPK